VGLTHDRFVARDGVGAALETACGGGGCWSLCSGEGSGAGNLSGARGRS
jgi:hypothetical protein